MIPRVRSCRRLVLGLLLTTLLSSGLASGQSQYHAPYLRSGPLEASNPAGGVGSTDSHELPGRPTSLPPPIAHADGDEFWSDEFGLPIPNSSVTCAVVFQGDLIVGGDFTQIGGRAVNYIARWNGSEWLPVGGGVDGIVAALLVDGARLFVGGGFRHAGSQRAEGVAAWDGTSWTPVGSGSFVSEGDSYVVRTMARFHGDLIVGGSFESSLDPAIRGVARFDGREWHSLGAGVTGDVRAMVVYRDSLYAAGDMSAAGTVPVGNIARWDGTGWADLEGGLLYGTGEALAVYGDRLYVGGTFRVAGNLDVWALATWNGEQWEAPVSSRRYLYVTSLQLHQGQLIIGHTWGFDAWDGVSIVDGPIFFGWPQGMASNGADLIVVGHFTTFESQPVFHVGRWDGTRLVSYNSWRPSMHGLADVFGNAGGVSTLAAYRGGLLAIQTFSESIKYFGSGSGWGEAGLIPTWDGSTWKEFDPLPVAYPGVPSVVLPVDDRLYFGGQFYDQAPPYLTHLVVEFDGRNWSTLDALPGLTSALAWAGGRLYAATGSTQLPGGPVTQVIYEWMGENWEEIASVQNPVTSPIEGLVEYRGELVAFGRFETIGEISVRGIAAWNGAAWHSLGNGPVGCFMNVGTPGIAASGERLILPTYQCDCCSDRGTLQAWNGDVWETLPGFHGYVTAMANIHGVLYVSGRLTLEGGSSEVSVAAWDGQRWSTLGSGLDGGAYSIVEQAGAIYFGGPFSAAGGKASFGIARWNGTLPTPPSLPPLLSTGRPNPFLTTADFTFRLEHDGMVHVDVYDVQGREVVALVGGQRTAGVHPIHWDGRDRSGRNVPAGVYFVSVRSANGSVASRKIVRLE